MVFTQAQQTVSLNDEARVVFVQQSPAVTGMSQGYAIPGQLPTVYIPPQVSSAEKYKFLLQERSNRLFMTERQSAHATKHIT